MALRVLIVDDSPFVREVLRAGLTPLPDLEVIGEAGDGVTACRLVRELQPDVVTMDVVMPLLGGLEAIRTIMTERPTPIVVVADAGDRAEHLAVEALAAGAVEVFAKSPRGFDRGEAERLAQVLRLAATVRVARRAPHAHRSIAGSDVAAGLTRVRLVVIVASTGGPPALAALLGALPASFAVPIALVQHTAPGFTEAFASWLDASVALGVEVARPGAALRPGHVLVAPDHHHLEIAGGDLTALTAAPPVGGHRPAGDVLLASAARAVGAGAMGIVLTGMGADGATGLGAIARAGGVAAAEHPASAVLDGMPRAALRACPDALVGTPAELGLALRGIRSRG